MPPKFLHTYRKTCMALVEEHKNSGYYTITIDHPTILIYDTVRDVALIAQKLAMSSKWLDLTD